MNESAPWIIYTDGAARANPGPAAFAYIIERPGESTIEEKGCLGDTTNNIAEYTALIRALEHAQRLGGRRLVVNSDSELMVKQMIGAYKVKHPGLTPLYERAKALTGHFDSVTFRHIRRELNKRADQLCNEALDDKARAAPAADSARTAAGSKRAAAPRRGKIDTPSYSAKVQAVSEQAVDCLRAAAGAWARGDATQPPPDAVWEQLWDILRQEGVLV
jgi:ribonuclease HI